MLALATPLASSFITHILADAFLLYSLATLLLAVLGSLIYRKIEVRRSSKLEDYIIQKFTKDN